MNNTYKIIDRYYQSFINQASSYDFFLNLADYVKYLLDCEELKPIRQELIKQKKAEYRKLDLLFDGVEPELDKTKKELLKIVKDNGLHSEELPKILEEYDVCKNDTINPSITKIRGMSKCLYEITKVIKNGGKEELLKKFVDPNPSFVSSYYGNFIFSKALADFDEQKELIDDKEKVEIWAIYAHLVSAYKAITSDKSFGEYWEKLKQGMPEDDRPYQQKSNEEAEVWHSIGEWTEIKRIEFRHSISNFEPVFLEKETYGHYATRFHNYLLKELTKIEDNIGQEKETATPPNRLKSIHLIANSLEPKSVIFLVLDERFEMPIRCAVNNYNGQPTYIKKLYNIAYFLDVPNRKVDYSESLADNINNGLFRKRRVKEYMKTNKFIKKPTLVKKSEDGKLLVLKNEIPVKTALINSVPKQHQSLYIDKTK